LNGYIKGWIGIQKIKKFIKYMLIRLINFSINNKLIKKHQSKH